MQFQQTFRAKGELPKSVFSDSVPPSLIQHAASPPLSVDKGNRDQNMENKVMFWPRGTATVTATAIKTEVKGCTIQTLDELLMSQIILFAPDADNTQHEEQNIP